MKNKKLFWGLAAVCAVNFLAHLFVYPHLPETIPTHWGYNGQVDGWSPRWMDLMLAGLPLLLLAFLYVIPRIDPKAENFEKHRAIWNGCQTGITLFLVAMSWITELSVFGALPQKDSLVSSLICGGVGILLIGVGNYMPRIRQNYTFGCRTPWALADEHNWQRTQRMGGITFIVVGAALLAAGLFTGVLGQFGTIVLMLVPILGVVWIYLYSYLVFRGILK